MGFNAKLFEVVLYSDSSDLSGLKAQLDSRSGLRDYAYCIHDKDGGKAHCHLMLRMNNSYNSSNVAKWFDVKENQVEKCKGRWSDMLAYLTHKNAPKKYQYDEAEVISNFDWKKEVNSAKKNASRLPEILDGVASGEIRKFNIFEHMSVHEFTRFKSQIHSAFEYRTRMIKGVDREMESIYIYGGSGTGKTTLAKRLAEDGGYSVYISSGSNDVLDDYEGQDCIILDDLRPSCLGLSDLLKMLDPRTASSVKSRYYNKVLECKLIIITTTRPMDDFFNAVFENEKEPLKQLERRCRKKIHLDKKSMVVSMYNDSKGCYVKLPKIENIVLAEFKLKDQSIEEMVDEAADMFKGFAGFTDAMKDQLKNGKKQDPRVEDALDLFNGTIVDDDDDY